MVKCSFEKIASKAGKYVGSVFCENEAVGEINGSHFCRVHFDELMEIVKRGYGLSVDAKIYADEKVDSRRV